ncbi:UDP-glucose/GDP-mannose dehydrogenase family protein [Streptomyces samsunensis]|uniref:UDP-glucose 6-dehydrogenase n=2 Tax=Streptomyces malaysiensis TaxID=92644 RepID=A0ABX6W4P0_STRMQ|nr:MULTISPECIES: UDP-glucose/GDP-mannose dehydrogenase family protein [Streptomyces]MYU16763.1 nucleotide sugar dehydrogenase [Streptomyces sp. SID8361]ATL80808.1 UDP-glucose 6-dehydrogenase protein [Streptomyces malaysiensis]MCC4318819.1 UDP-glucose/GDP-mannose dehydrogenase family protein [Streptomyces malaysiensis]MCD9589223.1 UDP-glucose/GDP-mannose dehydrogenase family protein [Streptomyces sp. 8ZJF_21]MCM3811539.1 UDP-glucose/GDP-mannose dehydrogenase family protein [Streptomyces sp. DR7
MQIRRVAVVGTGYVGLTTGACLATLGHRVVCADTDRHKVERLRRGEVDILEPRLPELVREGLDSGRLEFVQDTRAAVADADVVFLCLPTPMGVGGAADLAAVEAVADQIRDRLPHGSVVVNKSTVPVGTAERVAALLDRPDVAVVSNPEFLREGYAVRDFLHPDRIVVGAADPDAARRVADLYAGLDAPLVLTEAAGAELAKYAANFFLAMKLSFANNLATLCEHFGADVDDVLTGIGHDPRIGSAFLKPGPGWGGSCLPKDTHALLTICQESGVDFPLLGATIETNVEHQRRLVERVVAGCTPGDGSLRGVRLAVLGLAFKAGTSDLRDSPALAIARLLKERGAELHAYDPALRETRPDLSDLLTLTDTPEEALRGARACLVLTEWPEFRDLDWERAAGLLGSPAVYDFRNLLDPDRLRRAGLSCEGIGRTLAMAR